MFRRFFQWWRALIFQARGDSEFLCDRCRYNYPSACRHRERPNAVRCDDYKRK